MSGSESRAERQAEMGDLDAIVELDRRCFTQPWTAASWAAEIEAGGVWVLEGPQLCAYACAPCLLERCELRRIAVAPSARKRGLGRDLLMLVIQRVRARGCTVMELEVAAANVAARALYEGLGFRVVGRRAGYYRHPPDDALLYDLALDQDFKTLF